MNSIIPSSSLARIASYLTFDGHLAKDLSCFYLSSKNKNSLINFERLVSSTFHVKGRLEEGCGFGQSYKYRVFNKRICLLLKELGIPSGNKVAQAFLIPSWIKENRKFARLYVQTAFDCEGSIWFEKQPKIRFGIFKTEKFLQDGFYFLEEIKKILNIFGIITTETWIMKGNVRKDGSITKGLYFKISQKSLLQFAHEIGFSDSFKKERLIRMLGAKLPSAWVSNEHEAVG